MKTHFILLSILALSATVTAQTLTDPALQIEPVLTTQTLPENNATGMAFIGPDDILVNIKGSGEVRRITSGVLQTSPVLNLPVNIESERGLLGIALDPDFPNVPDVYLYYTAASADGASPIANRVSKFTWDGSTLINESVVIDLPVTPGPNHDGGIIKFGPPNVAAADQKLFIVIGDLKRDNQTENYPSGADADNSAVILRINRDGTFPTDGPFYAVAGSNDSLKTMYAYGVRNSYGMDFDPVNNELWDTENGPNSNDEINRVEPASNSGWETIMGPAPATMPSLVQFSGVGTYSDPEFTWNRIVAPTAIHFMRGDGIGAQYENDCFVGCTSNGKLYRFEPNSNRTGFELTGDLADLVWTSSEDDSQIVFGTNFGTVTDIVTGPDGNLYILDLNAGNIFRISKIPSAVKGWELYQ